jgi:Mrp family chromosome partitioning ATPase
MSENNCSHECDSCQEENCPSRGEIKKLVPHSSTTIKKTIAIVSGKGGVGKSLVTSLLASELHAQGHKVAIMDADITGPSIPKAFGVTGKAEGDEDGIFALKSKTGIPLMSTNCLLENDTDPVIWRGPMIANLVGQLYTNVIYGEVEYFLIDMPPGTGDVPLTVFQTIPVDGVIIVTSPQDLVNLIVEKSLKMANLMNIPVLGIITNMAYLTCPKCGEKIYLYGKAKTEEVAASSKIDNLDEVAIDPELATYVDKGEIEDYKKVLLPKAIKKIESL